MANVKGIGGVFLYSDDASRLTDWYQTMLGIDMEAHPDGTSFYRVFSTRDLETSAIRENPVFAIRQAEEKLAERGRGFMINLRVDDLGPFLEDLRGRVVEVEEEILEWERGKHAWIRDLDGNRVELYEELEGRQPA